MNAIDTVVFDFGQVLVRWDPRRVWQELKTPQEIETMLTELDFSTINRALDAGARWDELRPQVAEEVGTRVEDMDTYVAHYQRSLLGPVAGSADLVRDVQGLGVRTVGLTNWAAETFHHAATAAPITNSLRDVVVSGQVGLIKPDPAIFSLANDRFGLTPARTAFLDDSRANVEAARAAGWYGHVFTGADQARAWLCELGLSL